MQPGFLISSSEQHGRLPDSQTVSPMQLPNLPPITIKYSILHQEDNSVLLCLWEPAVMNETRVKPFLYMVRQRLPSEAEALDLLQHYLAVYRYES
jgi:hypothetical protein